MPSNSTDPATILHELLHYYSSPAFRGVAQSYGVGTSNLSEGATEFLLRQMMPGVTDRPYNAEAAKAAEIYNKIGQDAFYRAYFQGDLNALGRFDRAASELLGEANASVGNGLLEASQNPQPSKIPAAQVQGLADLVRLVSEGKYWPNPNSPNGPKLQGWDQLGRTIGVLADAAFSYLGKQFNLNPAVSSRRGC